jgi:hypothetical protein
LVTEPEKADAVLVPAEEGDAVGLAVAAGLDAAELDAAELDGAELDGVAGAELELEPELQAATPATRLPATAIVRHLERVLIGRRIPVKRAIAPFRLSAV